ncbi:MAG TPA: site-specific integrase [Bradyrhizobium sp.]|nr:site-specific integrase [Bradyrhizobium sp.]
MARHYIGNQSYEVESLATADDHSDADGVAILDYRQAQARARERMVTRAHTAAGKTGPLTVRAIMMEYLEFLQNHRKSGGTARYSINAFILPELGDLEAESLTVDQLRNWHMKIANSPARQRTKPGTKQNHRAHQNDPDWKRRRKSTANRILKVLKGGLNYAWNDKKLKSDAAWRRVKPFKGAESARVRYLAIVEARRLLNASDPDFRQLVEGALQTGARYGELIRFKVADFDVKGGTVSVDDSKGGRPRHIILTDEGVAFFRSICVGRASDEPIFKRADGTAWIRSAQQIPIKEASRRAKISPPINFHGLRHTWASHAVMGGVPLMVVAKNLGHVDTKMVEAHYGHLAPSYVADAIRAGAPRFGSKSNEKLLSLSERA